MKSDDIISNAFKLATALDRACERLAKACRDDEHETGPCGAGYGCPHDIITRAGCRKITAADWRKYLMRDGEI